MQTEDDDIAINSSPPDSQTSSIEGVYPTPSKTTHPFRIIEHDTLSLQSMTSLGRVGRILAGIGDSASTTLAPNVTQCPPSAILTRESQMSSIASIPSKDEDTASGKVSQSSSILTLSGDILQESSVNSRSNYISHSQNDKTVMLQEPDVIASTKNNGKSNEDITMVGIPVAPPRRKKKSKVQTPSDLAVRYLLIYNIVTVKKIFCKIIKNNINNKTSKYRFMILAFYNGIGIISIAVTKSCEYYRIHYQRI